MNDQNNEPFVPLLKKQKNDLYKLLRKSGLNPNDFEWIDIENRRNDKSLAGLIFKDNSYFFHFGTILGSGKYDIAYSPASNKLLYRDFDCYWKGLIDGFQAWILALVSELETPDLWEISKSDTVLIEQNDNDNDQFAPEEIKKIESHLGEIAAYIKSTIRTSDEQQESVDNKLNYLVDAAKRQTKRDWKNLAFSVLIQIIIALSVNQETGNDILRFASSILKDIFVSGVKAIP